MQPASLYESHFSVQAVVYNAPAGDQAAALATAASATLKSGTEAGVTDKLQPTECTVTVYNHRLSVVIQMTVHSKEETGLQSILGTNLIQAGHDTLLQGHVERSRPCWG